MDQHLLFLIVGLGGGAAVAALAMALVTTYRGTGVINIAQGAMAMWAAFVYDELRRTGDLVLPLGRVHVGVDIGGWSAAVVGVLSGAALAFLVHLFVFRPLRAAPALARVVASVGVALVLQALTVLRFGTTRRAVPALLPNDPVELRTITFSIDRLWLAGVAAGLGVLLWAYGRFTRAGLATRAAAQDEEGAILLGHSPDRLAALTWVLGAVVGGVVAILASPTTGLDSVSWTLLVVPALACALVGRLDSIGLACVAGLALGAVQSEITLLSSRTWWPDAGTVGVAQSVPFLVIVVALFLAGRSLPDRGSARLDPLPPVAVPRARPLPAVGVVALGAAAVLLTSGTYRFGVVTSMIVALIALSLVVLTGLVGQISLAQAAFAGSAGFTLSKIGTAVPFPFSMLLAAAVATALGLLVGIPALRIRGVHLAVVTLAAGVAIEQLVFRNPELSSAEGNHIPDPSLFGIDLSVRHGTDIARWQFGFLVLVVLALSALAVSNLTRSATGRSLLAVRSNERAAAAAGVDVARAKLLAFTVSSFLAGLGGTLLGYSRGQLSADSFGVVVSLSVLAFAYLGGITSVGGALVAGSLAPLGIGYVILERSFELGDRYLLVSGLLLLVTAVANPGGIAGRTRAVVTSLSHRRRPRPEPAPPLPHPTLLVQGD